MMKLGLLYLDWGKNERAGNLLRQALGIQKELLGPDHPDVAWTEGGLARVSELAGDTVAARAGWERVLDIRRMTYGVMHPDVGLAMTELAAFLTRRGDLAAALQLSLGACALGREHVQLTLRGYSERQALAYVRSRPYGLDVALRIVGSGKLVSATDIEQVWDALIRSRALVMDEIALRQRIAASSDADPDVRASASALESSRRELSRLLVLGGGEDPSAYEGRIAEARSKVERAERNLAARSASFVAAMSRRDHGWSSVRAAMPHGTALIGYALYDVGASSGYVAFLLRPDAPTLAIPLGTAPLIDRRVREWTAKAASEPSMSTRLADESACRAAGTRLRHLVWDPLELHLSGVDRVFIVPDGSLYRLNFAALPAKEHAFLVETGPTLHYLSTERDVLSSARHRDGYDLLAVGGPDFGTPARRTSRTRVALPSCVDFREVTFEPLPESLEEAREIAKTWEGKGNTRLLTGSEATEAAFKRSAPGMRVLHVATHGFFIGTDCGLSTQGGRGIGGLVPPGSNDTGEALQRSLRLSGLVFADANRRAAASSDDEGILTAQEISSLDLSSVEWAVLSACDTGRGEIQAGEGVLGLRRALQVAGVATTILSLWTIEDRSARDWMRELYRSRIENSRETSEAVREASLRVLGERRAHARSTHPFYWAGFVASGGWN